MYSQGKVTIALKLYHQCRSVTKTVQTLGYPIKKALYDLVHNEGKAKKQRKILELTNTKTHPRNPPVEVKMDALYRCFELGESIKSVSEDIGYTRVSIYAWQKKYLRKGTIALMNDKNKLFPTTSGSPQGGAISSLLANMTLDSLEKVIQNKYH